MRQKRFLLLLKQVKSKHFQCLLKAACRVAFFTGAPNFVRKQSVAGYGDLLQIIVNKSMYCEYVGNAGSCYLE
jgi:hypothetical protein